MIKIHFLGGFVVKLMKSNSIEMIFKKLVHRQKICWIYNYENYLKNLFGESLRRYHTRQSELLNS